MAPLWLCISPGLRTPLLVVGTCTQPTDCGKVSIDLKAQGTILSRKSEIKTYLLHDYSQNESVIHEGIFGNGLDSFTDIIDLRITAED